MQSNIVIVRLYRGTSLISKLIKWQTRGEYSHAAIIVGGALYEAKEFKGVQKRMALDGDDVDYDDFFVETTKEQRAGLIEFLEKQLGKGYDYWAALAFITRSKLNRKITNEWICSEYVFASLKKVGVEPLSRIEAYAVSPMLLGLSPIFLPVPA
jgi:hypothetical protein